MFYNIVGYMFRLLSSHLQALKMGILQCSKRLYVWIYILTRCESKHVAHNAIIYYKNTIKILLWSFPLILYFKHFGMVNVKFQCCLFWYRVTDLYSWLDPNSG